jgi:hypothetical protein
MQKDSLQRFAKEITKPLDQIPVRIQLSVPWFIDDFFFLYTPYIPLGDDTSALLPVTCSGDVCADHTLAPINLYDTEKFQRILSVRLFTLEPPILPIYLKYRLLCRIPLNACCILSGKHQPIARRNFSN